MKKRGHATRLPGGAIRVDPCPDDGPALVGTFTQSGKPVPPGCGLAMVYPPDEDGHSEYEVIVRPSSSSGPPQVATSAYRQGWDATFKGGLN
jgi:hypothetical protein